jgi:4'-phosphopantetheinyl transferase
VSIQPVPSPIDDCRIWRVDLDAAPASAGLLGLSEAERARAARFVFERDRTRFVAAHAALRQLLARHTGIAAAELEFVDGEFGKPSLAGVTGVRFNLSHSRSVGLIAIGKAGVLGERSEVGIDVEVRRAMPDALELARDYFSAGELQSLQELPAASREEAFLIGWTRKEAFLKALGLGITVDLRQVHVGLQNSAQSVKYVSPNSSHLLNVVSIPVADDVFAAIALSTSETTTKTKELAAPESAPLELLP